MTSAYVYPGKTSTRRVGSSLLTFQTELRGEPPVIVTIVVLKGRALRTFTQPLAELEARRPGVPLVRLVDEAHERVVARLHLTRKGDDPAAPRVEEAASDPAQAAASAGERASELVLLAVEAVDRLEYQAALDLLETALECAPGDPRLERSIARLRDLV